MARDHRTVMTAPFDGTPLDPTSPEARQWLRQELAKGEYHAEPSWWQRFVEWLTRLLDGPSGGGLPGWVVTVAVLVLLAVVALVVVRLIRPEAVTRGNRAPAAILEDEGLGASDYRRRAHDAAARADWDQALLDSYRALAASAVERTLLTALPGRTAHEVAVALAPVFPDHRNTLASAAAAFDDVRYGHRATSQERARAAAELDEALLQARPQLGRLVPS
jgi:hypothetical protein